MVQPKINLNLARHASFKIFPASNKHIWYLSFKNHVLLNMFLKKEWQTSFKTHFWKNGFKIRICIGSSEFLKMLKLRMNIQTKTPINMQLNPRR